LVSNQTNQAVRAHLGSGERLSKQSQAILEGMARLKAEQSSLCRHQKPFSKLDGSTHSGRFGVQAKRLQKARFVGEKNIPEMPQKISRSRRWTQLKDEEKSRA